MIIKKRICCTCGKKFECLGTCKDIIALTDVHHCWCIDCLKSRINNCHGYKKIIEVYEFIKKMRSESWKHRLNCSEVLKNINPSDKWIQKSI